MLYKQLKHMSIGFRLYLVFLVFLILSVSVSAQSWESRNLPLADQITGISFLSIDSGYIVSNTGQCLRTYNGGLNWTILPIDPNAALDDIYFLSIDTGFVCGKNGTVYKTTNAGNNWEKILVPDTICWLTGIVMVDGSEGIVLGLSRTEDSPIKGVAFRTEDGGSTWIPLPQMGMAYGEPFYRPGRAINFLSWGGIHTSSNRGRTWNSLKTLDGKPGRALAFHGKTGLIVGNDGMAAFTGNSGATWTAANTDSKAHLTSVVLVTDSIGYAGGVNGTLLRTFDAGRSWEVESIPKNFDVFDLELVGNILYAVGSKGGFALRIVESADSTAR